MAMDLQKSKSNSIDAVLSFTKHVLSKEEYQEKNLVFSPLSLYAALSVMAAGADGLTLDELLSFLRFDSVDHLTTFFSQVLSPVLFSDDHLSFANGMWVDQSLSIFHSFKQLVSTHYKATLASLDFQTKGDEVLPEVDSWVEKETNGHITDLVPPEAVTNSTRFIFANALRFNDETDKLSSKSGFFKGKLPRKKKPVRCLRIPKFSISSTFQASDMLKKVGVLSPFSPQDADFTKMVEVNSTSDKLYVENIFHKVSIQVTEQGTEATAATVGIGRAPTGGFEPPPSRRIDFVADHPFLFLIREDFTGTILFIGQVLNPRH
ncbi:serpin-Z2A-like [Lotus japonicus]|uniref:serpin-Z2A-like n=1 Tax=Lotus japonicus TaxID=34305 RepID=UPI0025850A79|nr:serpin-Z2A-like [Lotus japonicus]XP_057427361.1 serpin-Z2A-like [Lotus japonicus]